MNPRKLLTAQIECVVQMVSNIVMKIPTFAIHIMGNQDMIFAGIDATKINASDEVMPACMAKVKDHNYLFTGSIKQLI
jgi:hypothetical protein